MASQAVGDARFALFETLDHWKDDTRPGDDAITGMDVVNSIGELVEAMIDEALSKREKGSGT